MFNNFGGKQHGQKGSAIFAWPKWVWGPLDDHPSLHYIITKVTSTIISLQVCELLQWGEECMVLFSILQVSWSKVNKHSLYLWRSTASRLIASIQPCSPASKGVETCTRCQYSEDSLTVDFKYHVIVLF